MADRPWAFVFSIWVKFFALFTPFFALSMFLSITKHHTEAERRRLAGRVCIAVTIFCGGLFLYGKAIFQILGITLDAFRVGAGALLFLSAVKLVQAGDTPAPANPHEDIAVVPLAMPVVVGPATTGTLLVLGAELPGVREQVLGAAALLLAILSLAVLLLLGSSFERAVGKRGLDILSKLTGLLLATLAAQLILTGVRSFLAAPH